MSQKDYLTVKQVAKILPVTLRTVYRLIETGEIPSSRVGKKILVKKTDFQQYLFDKNLNE